MLPTPRPPAAWLHAVKAGNDDWKVALQSVIGGTVGAVRSIVSTAQLLRPRRIRGIRRDGRIVGAVGSLAGAGLMVADLRTPRRWGYVLRILRPGAAAPSGLGAGFASGAMAGGAAVLSVLALRRGDHRAARTFDALACTSLTAQLAASRAAAVARRERGIDEVRPQGRWALMRAAGTTIGIVLPLACYGVNGWRGYSRTRSMLAAAGILGGSLLRRWALLQGGNTSARASRGTKPEETRAAIHARREAPGRS